jgi:predicted PurR-regulated permease PerM
MYDLISKHISYIVASAINYGANIVNIIFLFVLAPITTFMMLKDHNLIYEKIRSLLPKKIEKEITELFTNIHESVFKYIEGQTITAVILSVCYSTILFFIGLEHFIVLGVLIGFSSFVPYIGFYSATIITLFSVYNQFYNFKQMLITIILLLIMQIIDCSFITPKIVGNKLGVHPLFIIFGVLASVPLFGFIGIILALPIVGIVGVLVKFLIKKYKNSSYYNS